MFNIKPLVIAVALTVMIASTCSFNVEANGQNSKNKLPEIGISGASVISLEKSVKSGLL